MQALTLPAPGDLACWRPLARAALAAGWSPAEVSWNAATATADADLFAQTPSVAPTPRPGATPPVVPAAFVDLAATVLHHRQDPRLGLLYRVLWRIVHGEAQLLQLASDPDIVALRAMEKAVRRDSHKMKAFVRFREVEPGRFVAWFEPEHRIVRRVAPFFARRFAGMQWSILTPDECVHWDGQSLAYTAGHALRAHGTDALEHLWRLYYASIFNPARLNVPMMRKEMPQKYWKHLPEAQLIPTLVRQATQRTAQMLQGPLDTAPADGRRRPIPAPAPSAVAAPGSLAALHVALSACRACPLWQPATQAVTGSGPIDAQVVLIGEQPGDREDLAGEPFVGPAGKLLDRALAELAIPRGQLFLTNAVKHFKFEQRGKLRLHKRASAEEQAACRHWLQEELALLQPRLIVCLGLTAAQAVLGPRITLASVRGRRHPADHGATVVATLHPAALLRLPAEAFESTYAGWRDDLRAIGDFLAAA